MSGLILILFFPLARFTHSNQIPGLFIFLSKGITRAVRVEVERREFEKSSKEAT